MSNTDTKVINGQSYEFWHMSGLDTYEELPRHLIDSIETMVKEWLCNEEKMFEPMLQIDLTDRNGEWVRSLSFHRAEIHIKESSNSWSCWHIASNLEWPHLFSVRMDPHMGMNQNYEDFRMPNEVRCFNYSNDSGFSCYASSSSVLPKKFQDLNPPLTRYQILLDHYEKTKPI